MKNVLLSWTLTGLVLLSGCSAGLVFVSDRDGRDPNLPHGRKRVQSAKSFKQQRLRAFPGHLPRRHEDCLFVFQMPGENIYIMDLGVRKTSNR